MSTPLARCNQTGRPIPPEEAPKNVMLRCWFCGNARVYRRVSVNGVVHYTTHQGDEHTHPVCSAISSKNVHLEFEGIADTFHRSMLRNPKAGTETTESGNHRPYDDSHEVEKTEKLNSLSRLIKWGLYSCPDIQLNRQDRLSSILINSSIAPDLFASIPEQHMGPRAVVAEPEGFDDTAMGLRFRLRFEDKLDSRPKFVYFFLFMASREYFDEAKKKLFRKAENGESYVPCVPLAIIYGNWVGFGCKKCKLRNRSDECLESEHCMNYIFESCYFMKHFIRKIDS